MKSNIIRGKNRILKRIIVLSVILAFGSALTAQNKKVAVWETKCSDNSITPFQSTMVRGGMETAVANAPGYSGYDRASFDAILKEHSFQRSGSVKESDIKRLGEMAGVQYIIVPEANADGSDFYIIVKMLDVETGEFGAAYDILCGSSASEIKAACSELGNKLFGGPNKVFSQNKSNNRSQTNNADVITVTVAGVSFDMIKVEAGSFIMGCTSEQGGDCYGDESPYHRVTITQDYYIGKFEVTQELWEAVMGSNPSNWKAFDRPVENVSWNVVQEFCAELSRMTGKRFRLPTEAEWEYAARGGKKSTNAKYSGSSSVSNVAWYTDNSGSQTHPVGKLRPNELGIYDMSGNVWEWCQDWYGNYSSASQTDPQGPSSGSYRVLRGGSWNFIAGDCRVSRRSELAPGIRFDSIGFRLVLPQ
jgi:formylglycine-generating enzyme required for sulfatase activity